MNAGMMDQSLDVFLDLESTLVNGMTGSTGSAATVFGAAWTPAEVGVIGVVVRKLPWSVINVPLG